MFLISFEVFLTFFYSVIKKATGFHNFSEDDYQIISFTNNEKIIQHATPFKTEPEGKITFLSSEISDIFF